MGEKINYGYQKTVSKPFEVVETALRDALAEIGFGIITEIDVQKTFKEKLDIDYIKYRILGACNPTLAKQALDRQPEVGMLMPCNVIFWENDDKSTTLSAINAKEMLSVTGKDDLDELADQVNLWLQKAVDAV